MPTAAAFAPIYPLLKGFILCASMIVAVGPQNLFLLRQGLQRRNMLTTAAVSTLGDVALISLGVGGVGRLLAVNDRFLVLVIGGGALFLLWCGGRSLFSACRPPADDIAAAVPAGAAGFRASALAAIGFSLLNPAAYLDTLVIIGASSGSFPVEQRMLFGLGAITASALWFFTLTYGAGRLAPLLQRPIAWRILDLAGGAVMVGIACLMVASHYQAVANCVLPLLFLFK
ncbi:MAG: LysE family transporter [Caldilineaceae bacterium]|nr:LysE family transporter [Caldilineaceae bacterium]